MPFLPIIPRQFWSFQWQALNDDRWHAKAKSWKTDTGAAAAARKWKKDMAAEGCEVKCRLVELVPEGTGRVARVVWSD